MEAPVPLFDDRWRAEKRDLSRLVSSRLGYLGNVPPGGSSERSRLPDRPTAPSWPMVELAGRCLSERASERSQWCRRLGSVERSRSQPLACPRSTPSRPGGRERSFRSSVKTVSEEGCGSLSLSLSLALTSSPTSAGLSRPAIWVGHIFNILLCFHVYLNYFH